MMSITIFSSYLAFSICYRICESKFILSKREIISILNQIISYIPAVVLDKTAYKQIRLWTNGLIVWLIDKIFQAENLPIVTVQIVRINEADGACLSWPMHLLKLAVQPR